MTTGTFEDVELEPVACMLCGEDDAVAAGEVVSHDVAFTYRLCRGCGLKYMSPRPTRAWYDAHYAGQFWEYKAENRSWQDERKRWRWRDFLKRNFSGRQRRQASRLDLLIPLIEANADLAHGRLLDVGCAFGAISAGLVRHFACRAFGVEPNASARAIAREKNGVTIFAESAEELIDRAGGGERFDVVLMSNVLENILDPRPVLGACRKLIGDDGRVCVHMPNFFFYDAMNPYHPYIYSPDTLARLFVDCGYEITAIDAAAPAEPSSPRRGRPTKEERFMTLFAKPGKAGASHSRASVDTDRLIAAQAASLGR